jgi:hypothetical protein
VLVEEIDHVSLVVRTENFALIGGTEYFELAGWIDHVV